MKRSKRNTGAQTERAALYVRVSLDRAAHGITEEIISPETQQDRARAYCASQGWTVAMVEQDIDESAYRQHYSRRAGLARLLEAVERGEITKVIVWKWSRLSRRLNEFIELCGRFEAAGAGVVSVSEQVDTSTPSGRLIRNILASFAQYQSEELSEQISESWITLAKRGERPPGIAPFGAINEKGILKPDPATHGHLLAMYRTFVETRSTGAVWDYLTARQVEPPRAEIWSRNTITKILTNPAYVGELHWVGEQYEGKWEPLVPPDLWEAAQEIITGRKTGPRGRSDARTLTGLVTCTSCGRTMWNHYVQRQHDGVGYVLRTYHCYKPGLKRGGCSIPDPHADELEAAVWQTLLHLVRSSDPDALITAAARESDTAGGDQPDRGRLLAEKRQLEAAAAELLDQLLVHKAITQSQFQMANRRYVERLQAIDAELGRMPAGPGTPAPAAVRNAIRDAPTATTPESRRQILADLGARVEVSTSRVDLVLLGLRINLRARRIGDMWHLGPDYQRLNYQGSTLTDRQGEFIRRTYAWADKDKLAKKLGMTRRGLIYAAFRLRKKGVFDSASTNT